LPGIQKRGVGTTSSKEHLKGKKNLEIKPTKASKTNKLKWEG
jgi:hypothetical protein